MALQGLITRVVDLTTALSQPCTALLPASTSSSSKNESIVQNWGFIERESRCNNERQTLTLTTCTHTCLVLSWNNPRNVLDTAAATQIPHEAPLPSHCRTRIVPVSLSPSAWQPSVPNRRKVGRAERGSQDELGVRGALRCSMATGLVGQTKRCSLHSNSFIRTRSPHPRVQAVLTEHALLRPEQEVKGAAREKRGCTGCPGTLCTPRWVLGTNQHMLPLCAPRTGGADEHSAEGQGKEARVHQVVVVGTELFDWAWAWVAHLDRPGSTRPPGCFTAMDQQGRQLSQSVSLNFFLMRTPASANSHKK